MRRKMRFIVAGLVGIAGSACALGAQAAPAEAVPCASAWPAPNAMDDAMSNSEPRAARMASSGQKGIFAICPPHIILFRA